MAKKQKKARPEEKLEYGRKAILTAAEIKKFQKVISDVGTRKKEGFIFVAVKGKPDKEHPGESAADGVLFTSGVSPRALVGTLIGKLEMGPLEVLSILSTNSRSDLYSTHGPHGAGCRCTH